MTTQTLTFIGGYGSGIGVYARNGAGLRPVAKLDTPDPSFLIADPRRPVLYAVNELAAGTVSSYTVEPGGAPRTLSTRSTGGAEPCHLALYRDHLVAANYGSGSASVHPVAADGALGEATEVVRHHGSGPDPDRQDGPHAHQVHLSDDLVTVVDLGLDRLAHYRLDGTGRLAAAGQSTARPGAGPRHAVEHPSGRWYVSCELDSTVAVFEPDPSDGGLRLARTYPATADPAVSTGDLRNYPAGIALSRDGRYLYVGNRGADTIATFAVGPDGDLSPLGEVGTGGRWPRHFTIAGDLLYVANQRSNTVVTLRLDAGTGLPAPTGEIVEVGSPSCVLVTDWPA